MRYAGAASPTILPLKHPACNIAYSKSGRFLAASGMDELNMLDELTMLDTEGEDFEAVCVERVPEGLEGIKLGGLELQ